MKAMFNEYFIGIISNIVIACSIFVYVNVSKNITIFYSISKWILTRFTGKKYFLIWCDHNLKASIKIIKQLERRNPQLKYVAINKPNEVCKFPLYPSSVQAIVFIVTDVTKLSESLEERNIIQEKILKYVGKGGTFIGTHDVIYRRTRNELFEVGFGCKILNFQREDKPICYVKVAENSNHPIIRDLPNAFYLDDCEVCWGGME